MIIRPGIPDRNDAQTRNFARLVIQLALARPSKWARGVRAQRLGPRLNSESTRSLSQPHKSRARAGKQSSGGSSSTDLALSLDLAHPAIVMPARRDPAGVGRLRRSLGDELAHRLGAALRAPGLPRHHRRHRALQHLRAKHTDFYWVVESEGAAALLRDQFSPGLSVSQSLLLFLASIPYTSR